MNKQRSRSGRGIEWTDYTWNFIAGCYHGCRWKMADGTIAVCYAEDVAGGVALKHYPQGFAHHYWHPERLDEPLRVKKPARIFGGSMADLFGRWVPAEHIEAGLDICRRADWHTFQFLTKNPARVQEFTIPPNVWIGASTPPDFMWNKQMSRETQDERLRLTLASLAAVDVPVRWMSIEPLSRDYADILAEFPGVLSWAVIGAASAGPRQFPPAEADFLHMLDVLDRQRVAVFFKGNLKSLDRAKTAWREDFPGLTTGAAAVPAARVILSPALPMLPAPTGDHLKKDYCYLPPKQLRLNRILCGDAGHYTRTLPDNSVNCVVTSPPYFNQRDYFIPGQMGLEKTVDEYVANMVRLFREIRRVLRPDGTLWLNLGDSYAVSGRGGRRKAVERRIAAHNHRRKPVPGFKRKDLLGIPWRVALALQADGWYLRVDNIWNKTSTNPDSATDRPSRVHEYVFLLSKSHKYFYDGQAVRVPVAASTIERGKRAVSDDHKYVNGTLLHGDESNNGLFAPRSNDKNREVNETRNLPSVWSMSAAQYKGKHTATMPPAMVELCLKAGCPKDGIVFDPFMGAGTTALVALRLDRNFVGCELNPASIAEANQRLAEDSPMQPKTIRAKRGGEQAVQYSLFRGL